MAGITLHEHGMADDILKVLLEQAQQHGAKGIKSATIELGEFSGISADVLRHDLEHCCEHEDMLLFDVEFTTLAPQAQCENCGEVFPLGESDVCPKCQSGDYQVRPANGVTIKSVEFE